MTVGKRWREAQLDSRQEWNSRQEWKKNIVEHMVDMHDISDIMVN